MAYNPAIDPAIATAIKSKRQIARAAGTTGAGARGTTAPRPPAVGSPGWYLTATPAEIAAYATSIRPDYSRVPKVNYAAASAAATKAVDSYMAPYEKQQKEDLASLAADKDRSLAASTAFTSALASILTGGLEGEAGREYAKKTFGGSYLGEVQAADGMRMAVDLSSDFSDQEKALRDRYAQVFAKRADLYEQVYSDFVQQEQRNQELGIKIAESDFDHRFKAATLALAAAQKAASGSGSSSITYVTQPGGGVVGFDKATGKIVYRIPGTGTTGGSSSGSTKVYGNSTTGYYTMQGGKLVPVPGFTGSGSGGGGKAVSPASASAAVARAASAGDDALEKVTDKIWARTPGSSALSQAEALENQAKNYGADSKERKALIARAASLRAEAEKAEAEYNRRLTLNFGTAMAKVIGAIGPHLKAAGYNRARIRAEAFRIVTQEIDPPKGYKKPTVKNASFNPDDVIATSKGWSPTHVTDNLGWGTKTAGDIMGDPGSLVGAPEGGVVVRLGSAQGGSSMYFKGDSGRMYWLGHIDNFLRPGQRVSVNEPIARISADHPRPHVHIDVRGGAIPGTV